MPKVLETGLEAHGQEVTERDVMIRVDEGDTLLLFLEADEHPEVPLVLELVRWNEQTKEWEALSTERTQHSAGFWAKAFNGLRQGWYRVHAMAQRAQLRIIQYGREAGAALAGRGRPTETTCFVCKGVLKSAIKLALHALGAPLTGLPLERLGLDLDPGTLPAALPEGWFPDWADERIRAALGQVSNEWRQALAVAMRVANPVGFAAKKVCQSLNQCPS